MSDRLWQPIETAPRGQDVLVWDEIGQEQFVAFSVRTGIKKYEWCIYADGKRKVFVKNPAYWAPLPPPPEKSP
jgi:hypothetical protein